MTSPFRPLILLALLIALAACNSAENDPAAGPALPQIIRITERTQNGPEGAKEGACYGRDITPAVIETVTEQVIATPAVLADDGTVQTPASYRTETHQRIVEERREIWVETPCDEVQTIEFTASLQRALKARGFYTGPITAIPDAPTRRATRAYQATQGLDSAILSVDSARALGILAVEREE